jgi:D-methionine transport system permease protein
MIKLSINIQELAGSTFETVQLIFIPLVFVIALGLLFGFLLFITSDSNLLKRNKLIRLLHLIFVIIVDVSRSIPFMILIYAIFPFTVSIMGTMLGVKGAIPALIISSSPFYARIVFNSLKDSNKGATEALVAFGAPLPKIMVILLKEALPSLIRGITVTIVSLVGFVAAAGAVGAGGLGFYAKQKAITQDYQATVAAVVLILVLVFILQFIGDYCAKKLDKR